MHILFLTDNFPPEVNAPATRTAEHIMEWEKQEDVKITVITCSPNFPNGKLFQGYKNKIYNIKQWSEKIRVIRVWSYITSNKGVIRRILDYFSFAVTSFIAGLFVKDVDVIVATSPQFFTVWSGCALSKFKRVPWVFELRDLWPQSIETVGATSSKRVIRFLEKIELYLYRDAAAVVSVTKSFVEDIVSRGIDRDKTHVVTNGANLERYVPQEKDKEIIKKYNLEGHTVVGYVGTIGMAHSLYFILKAVHTLQGYKFLFIGDGAKRDYLLKLKKELGVKDVIFTGMVPKDEIMDYISVIDIALVNLKKSDDFKKVIPSKIFELASMEKPILLGVEGEAAEMLNTYGAGIAFEPENGSDFVTKLEKMTQDRELYKEMQTNCRKLAKAFDRKKLAVDMFQVIKNVVEKDRGAE